MYSQDKGMEISTEKWDMLMMKSGERETTEIIELSNQERIRRFGENENYENSGIL